MTEQRLPEIWRSFDELDKNDEYRLWAEREFRSLAKSNTNRRDFLKLVGASLAAAGLISCRREDARILPYGEQPPEVIPGLPLYYATTFVLGGSVTGVLAETHVGRPIKLEGNPKHPNSGGKLDTFGQAAVLDLYDPDRSRGIRHEGKHADWEKNFLPFWKALGAQQSKLAVLTGRVVSPALAMLREEVPNASFYEYEPLEFGAPNYTSTLDLTNAKVIVSLDCDFLGTEEDGVRHTRAFAAGRGGTADGTMNRLYVLEPHLSTTGAAADHRDVVRAGEVHRAAHLLLGAVRGEKTGKWFEAVAADLKRAGSNGVVLAGRRQPPPVHALARQINEALGSAHVAHASRRSGGGIAALANRLGRGDVDALLILDRNPVYDAPADLDFAALMQKAKTTVHLGLYRDETARAATWHVPQAHWLESWGDAESGVTLSPIQPMIDPILGGRSDLELLALYAGRLDDAAADKAIAEAKAAKRMAPVFKRADPFTIVRESFERLTGRKDVGARWRDYLHTGTATVIRGSGAPLAKPPGALPEPRKGWEVCFTTSASTWDGRFANNGWLQETPDPVTKLVWDNAAVMGPAAAKKLGVTNGDVVRIKSEGRTLDLPAFIMPGSVADSIQVALGYGRTEAGSLGRHAGANAYRLRTSANPGFASGATIVKTNKRHPLATTQQHWTIETHEVIEGAMKDRALIRSADKAHYDKHPDFAQHMGLHGPVLQDSSPRPAFTGDHQWGMSIDLNRCTGCNACAVACQAENNIPIVGKDEVIQGREMAWMRIDRFFSGDPEGDVSVGHQPMLCQHCENAPCEIVCPVNATVHNEEGLNVMAYNRCVGTRYCANNCPYKVRRFNYYDYNKNTLRESDDPFDGDPAPNPMDGLGQPQALQNPLSDLLRLQKNPDVTVRMRGVMEKCTFCTQRIEAARSEQKVQAGQERKARIPDGAVQTACQQSCPADAIVFGDISDPKSRVAKAREHQRSYAVLDHLNTRPRVTYMARIRNPNPALGGEGA